MKSKSIALTIGISGKAQAGKTTTAHMLKELTEKDGYIVHICSFATGVKQVVKLLFGLSDEDLKNKTKIHEPSGKTIRQLLQLIGTEAGRELFYDNIWIDWYKRNFIATMHEKTIIIFDDMRFKNELDFIDENNSCYVFITRPSISIKENNHKSENALDGFGADVFIDNDGSLVCLKHNVEEAWQYIKCISLDKGIKSE